MHSMTSETPNEVRTLQDLEKHIDAYRKHQHLLEKDKPISLIFRGQSDFEWPLQTTLERAFEKWDVPQNKKRSAERFLLKDFIRQAHHHVTDPPPYYPGIDVLEWLALMQHYGAPTRLLDWSYSHYYALFMALDRVDRTQSQTDLSHDPDKRRPFRDSAIWLTNARWLHEASNRALTLPENAKPFEHDENQLNKSYSDRITAFQDHIWPSKTLLAYPVNCFRLNERLAKQKGLFLCPGDATTSFARNLEALRPEPDRRVMKLRILTSDDAIRKELMISLQMMGIDRTQVYPGLQGFAASLEQRLIRDDLLTPD